MTVAEPHFISVKSFVDVPDSKEGIDTVAFLEASDGLVDMFDLFGSVIFGFLQADLRGNIEGLRKFHDTHEDVSGTLETLAKNAAACKDHSEGRPVTNMILLLRGLHYTCKALQDAQKDQNAELRACFKRAYDEVLSRYHPFLIRQVASVAIHAVPRREDFYEKLAQGAPMDALQAALEKWLAALERVVNHMGRFLEDNGYGTI